MREVQRSGVEALETVVSLARRCRLVRPLGGIWKAADLEWWWRRPRRSDSFPQSFWLDDAGDPVAGSWCTCWGTRWEMAVLSTPRDAEPSADALWTSTFARLSEVRSGLPVEALIRDDDLASVHALTELGFLASPDSDPDGWAANCWIGAADVPSGHPLPAGYRICSRSTRPEGPHPMEGRNGTEVEQRLRSCSIYDADLDLCVVAPDGTLAGYGLFWPDQVTKVGSSRRCAPRRRTSTRGSLERCWQRDSVG